MDRIMILWTFALLMTIVTTEDAVLCKEISKASAQHYEPPIMITYDLHADPFPQTMPLPQRLEVYYQWMDNVEWLLDLMEQYDGKVTFLSVGEFMEFALEDQTNSIPILRRLYENGGSLGTHSHSEHNIGIHKWPSFTQNVTEEQARKNWDDVIRFVNAVVSKVVGSNDSAEIAAVNNIRGGHIPSDRAMLYEFMVEYGFPVQEAGPGEPWYQFFGHHIWNPFRPAMESPWAEDLSTPFVYVPSGPVIGKTGIHAGVFQDMSLSNMKKMFLMLYLNWRYQEGLPDSDHVWTFGWASHTHDVSFGSQTRKDVEEFAKWLNDTFIGKQSTLGNVVAQWAGRKEVYDAYVSWEQSHPDQSSFNYPSDAKDYGYYPYLKPVQRSLENSYYVGEMTNFAERGVNAHRFVCDEQPLIVLWKDDGTATVDLSSEFDGKVRVTSAITGDFLIADSSSVRVSYDAVIVERLPGGLVGDLDNNGRVDILDVTIVALAFGSVSGGPGWNSTADVDRNRVVNILDISMVARDYGTSIDRS